MPAKKIISIPDVNTSIEVPKSGCFAIRMLGINIKINIFKIFLPDGGNFELSTMYHLIFLEDLLLLL